MFVLGLRFCRLSPGPGLWQGQRQEDREEMAPDSKQLRLPSCSKRHTPGESDSVLYPAG